MQGLPSRPFGRGARRSGWGLQRHIPSGCAAASGRLRLYLAQVEQGLQNLGVFLQGAAQPVRVEKPVQDQLQEGFELDVGHRKAVQGPVGGVAPCEPGPGQGREHGVDVKVVVGRGAGLAGGQPQVLLGVAEIELDREAVAVDAVDPFRSHLRVGVGVQDKDHAQQKFEELVVQLRMVQPLALVRQVAGGQVGDAGPLGGLQTRMNGIGAVLLQIQDRQEFPLLAPDHPSLAAVPAPADPRQFAAALGQAGAVPSPGQIVFIGHHRAQPGQVEGREVVGAGRLPTVRVGTATAETGQVAVRGPDRQAHQQGQQGLEVVPLRFAAGQGGQYSEQQGYGIPPGMVCGSHTHTIAGAVLLLLHLPPPPRKPK